MNTLFKLENRTRVLEFGRGLLKLAVLPALLISLATLRIFWPKRRIRIVVMEPRFFGHQCLEPEVFQRDRQLSIEQRSNDIWLCSLGKRHEAANEVVWDLRKNDFPVVPSWFSTAVVFWQQVFDFSQFQVVNADYHRLNFLATTATSLPLDSSFELRRKDILSHMSNPERPYVIFTARETTRGIEDIRDRDIRDFEPAILSLIEIGYNVIRLTSRTENLLRINSPHLIDWQVREDGRPGDELVLVSGASFVVSTTTGVDALALAYRRPVLYVDASRLFYVFLGTELATFQMPLVLDQKSGTALNLEQLLKRGLGWAKHLQEFSDAGVRIIKSSPEKLREIILEYVDFISSKPQPELKSAQDSWRSLVMHYLSHKVTDRHGEIQAGMHPDTLRSHL